MASDKFNSVGGFSVGIPPTEVIDETGNVSATSVIADTITASVNISAPVFYGDLVGNVYGESPASAVAFVQNSAPTSPITGTLWYDLTSNQLRVYSSTGWVGASPEKNVPESAQYDFAESLRWEVVHNKNTTKFYEYLTDESGRRFYARINILDSNRFEVLLTVATAGTVTVIFL